MRQDRFTIERDWRLWAGSLSCTTRMAGVRGKVSHGDPLGLRGRGRRDRNVGAARVGPVSAEE